MAKMEVSIRWRDQIENPERRSDDCRRAEHGPADPDATMVPKTSSSRNSVSGRPRQLSVMEILQRSPARCRTTPLGNPMMYASSMV